MNDKKGKIISLDTGKELQTEEALQEQESSKQLLEESIMELVKDRLKDFTQTGEEYDFIIITKGKEDGIFSIIGNSLDPDDAHTRAIGLLEQAKMFLYTNAFLEYEE